MTILISFLILFGLSSLGYLWSKDKTVENSLSDEFQDDYDEYK